MTLLAVIFWVLVVLAVFGPVGPAEYRTYAAWPLVGAVICLGIRIFGL